MSAGLGKPRGFVLTELLVTGVIAAFLMLGLVQMAAATSRGLRLVEALADTQQGGRFAIEQIRDTVMASGFDPAPWESGGPLAGLSDDSADGGPGHSDVLKVQQLSDRNCYDRVNTSLDDSGLPAFFLRVSTFQRSANGNLAHTCYFGPPDGALRRQINREGMVQRVESFQVLYAEDLDGDRRADRQVRAGAWAEAENIVGLQIGLLLATPEPVGDEDTAPLTVLDETVVPRADGRLRRVWTTTIPIGSKLR